MTVIILTAIIIALVLAGFMAVFEIRSLNRECGHLRRAIGHQNKQINLMRELAHIDDTKETE